MGAAIHLSSQWLWAYLLWRPSVLNAALEGDC
jgi:hypothetical protein